MIRYFVSLCFVACMLVNSHAQSVQVNAQFDSTAITVGDQIKFRIELERGNGVYVQFPVWADTLAKGIEIIEVHPVDSGKTANGMRFTQDITITSFESGQYVLPPISFPFVENGHADTLTTTPVRLDVHTMLMDSTQNIVDIKPVYQIPVGWADIWPWLLGIGGLLLLLALVGFMVYAIMRYRNNKPIFSTAKAEPPHLIALRGLDNLRSEKLWHNNRTKEYYTRLSDIVRTYIEGRFNVTAMEMTTDEILNGLRSSGFEDNNLVERLNKLFVLADLVKFAKAVPLPEENEASMLDSYLFVNNTKIETEHEASGSDNTPEGATTHIQTVQLNNK